MEFLIKFAQAHETFRVPEIEALALIEGLEMEIVDYSQDSPFCVVQLASVEAAQRLAKRSILIQSIHELWGKGSTLEELHESVRTNTSHIWDSYLGKSFKFDVDPYQGTRSAKKRIELINSFRFLGWTGPVKMSNPDNLFTIFEMWPYDSVPLNIPDPTTMYLARHVGNSSRDILVRFDLKKRGYISTTSMDSELALVTANIALAAPGKLFYDPFVGTGSFPIACAHFGALAFGSDIDGRSIRGEGGKKSLKGNFDQYGIGSCLGDVFSADLTNTPIRRHRRTWDGIVCDPPYGVREGLRVLGLRDPEKTPWLIEQGKQHGMKLTYVPPKKPYSFMVMLDDILDFAANTLVDDGRLSFWMPTANDENQEISVPSHPYMEVVVVCTQPFNKWSRRLITYRRIPDSQVSKAALETYANRQKLKLEGTSADELNPFRRGYFKKFEADE
ncbi:tRNA (guanine(10)-N2)-methyltransferase [Fusarium venenatum]|uniref:S-adenosyl-L-methionine-dependent methyltransferase n=1 Tax=Fusarium venenatum TaxID=56646 RepID=UPI001D74BB2E|nr:tRNA (guanine(10)-N2)-methyltransferase [Fusarium venenatum]KAH7003718.1 S-adenosyl-L-methionine-dependent methyltransferase [Fusarium venenatum]